MPHLWPLDCHLSGATLSGVGFRPSRDREPGAFPMQGYPMDPARGTVFKGLPGQAIRRPAQTYAVAIE